jgi:hypothetical protein
MSVCQRPNCDGAPSGDLGFCADHHTAYLRTRRTFAHLAEAAQRQHADAFALIPPERRPALAEYLVAIASEGLPTLPARLPRSAGLLAAALVAQGHADEREHGTDTLFLAPRSRVRRAACRSVGGRRR